MIIFGKYIQYFTKLDENRIGMNDKTLSVRHCMRDTETLYTATRNSIDDEVLKRPQTKLQFYWRPLVLSNGKTNHCVKTKQFALSNTCKIPNVLNY